MPHLRPLLVTMVCLLAGCGGGGGGDSTPSATVNPGTQATLAMPGLNLNVQRLDGHNYAFSSPEAAQVVNFSVLTGADWETAQPAATSKRADGSWRADLSATSGQLLMFRLNLADGNTIESAVARAELSPP